MELKRFALTGAAAGLAAAAAALALRGEAPAALPGWTVESSYPAYQHDDWASFRVRSRSGSSRAPALRVVGAGASWLVPLRGVNAGEWRGAWPVAWNLPAGTYLARLDGVDPAPGQRPASFQILPAAVPALPPRLTAAAFDASGPLSALKIKPSESGAAGAEALLDWVSASGVKALWLRPGAARSADWAREEAAIDALAQKAHQRGLKLGLRLDALAPSRRILRSGAYARSLDVERGQLVETPEISAGDLARAAELARELAHLRDIPGVDYLGLSRLDSSGGFELADAFYKEMPGEAAPAGWGALSAEAQAAFLYRRLQLEPALSERWRWWRARESAKLVRAVKAGVGADKPFWVFIPGRDLGHARGVDAAMLSDAGADMVVVQLYEADNDGFNRMLGGWQAYLARRPLPLGVADVPDWALHQFTTLPPGPDSMALRMATAAALLGPKSLPKAMVLEDLGRPLYTPLGPYPAMAWLAAARRAALDFSRVPTDPLAPTDPAVSALARALEAKP